MSEWITLRLPLPHETDENGDVFVPPPEAGSYLVNWQDYRTIKLGDPWFPKPKRYVQPKTREELVKDLELLIRAVDAYDKMDGTCEWPDVMKTREKLK
jgi:hypothetical protein